MPSYTPLTGPGSVGEAVSPLTAMNPEGVELLHSVINSHRSFSPRKEQIKALSDRLDIGTNAVEYLFLGLSALYSHVQTSLKEGMEFDEVITETAAELAHFQEWNTETTSKIRDILVFLLRTNETHEIFRKVERIRSGFQPHAVAFSSLVELRPRYVDGDEDELTIEGVVAAIQFRITTDDAKERHHVFQLTEEALIEFRRALDRLDRKVAALKITDPASLRIIEL